MTGLPGVSGEEGQEPVRQRFSEETSSLRSGSVIAVIYVAVMALILYGAWVLVAQDWAQHKKEEQTELSGLARAQAEYISRTFSQMSETMHTLADIVTFSRVPADTLRNRLNNEVTAGMAVTPELERISIYFGRQPFLGKKRSGSQVLAPESDPDHDCQPFKTPQPAASFVIQKEQLPGYIVLGKCFQTSRQRSDEQQVSISAALNATSFQNFFNEIRATPQDHFWLLSRNGKVLHAPNIQDPFLLEKIRETPLTEDRPVTQSDNTATIDAGKFIGVIRQINNLPLYIVVTRPVALAHAGFNTMRMRVEAGVMIVAILLAILCWTIYHDALRHAQSRAALQQLNASLEERVRSRTGELEQSNHELMAFSYSISHDLRAPLRAINGFAYALKEDYNDRLDEQGRDFVDRIYRASVRMGELIDELLALADLSRKPLERKDVDITALAREIMDGLTHNSPGRALTFHLQEDMKIRGDEALLGNALTNLLHNAWKFTRSRDHTEISLSATEEGEFLHFVLTDNGIGFDMAHAKRLFQPFEQLHVESGYGGTGIGLASVRRVLERHGGRIWAESRAGMGARFEFLLPR